MLIGPTESGRIPSLRKNGITRSHVRILDALLWSSHPTVSLGAQLAVWERRFIRRATRP